MSIPILKNNELKGNGNENVIEYGNDFKNFKIIIDTIPNYMDFYCEVCDKYLKSNTKYKNFKSNTHKEFDRCKHIKSTFENPNIHDVDGIFYAYNMEDNKKYLIFSYKM